MTHAPPASLLRSPSSWAVLVLLFYAVHAADRMFHEGAWWDLLWACNVACPLIAVGLLARRPEANAVGTLWLLYGNPIWVLEMTTGGDVSATSFLTHLGGLVVGVIGVVLLGMPRAIWWKAVVASVALQQFCRWVTPEAANVNLAHGVWAGWEEVFPSYAWYMALIFGTAAVVFFAAEHAGRRLLSRVAVRIAAAAQNEP